MTAGLARQLAIDYYDDGQGWAIYRIQRRLAALGLNVSWHTVKRWVMTDVDAAAERAADAERGRRKWRTERGRGGAYVFDEDALVRRVGALASVGLSSDAIAKVIWLDHHVLVTVARVERVLAGEPLTPTLREVLADAA